MKVEMEWIKVSDGMPDLDSVVIIVEMKDNEVNNFTCNNVDVIKDENGKIVFLDEDYEPLAFVPTHWAYLEFPYAD